MRGGGTGEGGRRGAVGDLEIGIGRERGSEGARERGRIKAARAPGCLPARARAARGLVALLAACTVNGRRAPFAALSQILRRNRRVALKAQYDQAKVHSRLWYEESHAGNDAGDEEGDVSSQLFLANERDVYGSSPFFVVRRKVCLPSKDGGGGGGIGWS